MKYDVCNAALILGNFFFLNQLQPFCLAVRKWWLLYRAPAFAIMPEWKILFFCFGALCLTLCCFVILTSSVPTCKKLTWQKSTTIFYILNSSCFFLKRVFNTDNWGNVCIECTFIIHSEGTYHRFLQKYHFSVGICVCRMLPWQIAVKIACMKFFFNMVDLYR